MSIATEPLDSPGACDTPRPAGVRDYVSASRLGLWLKCPLAFKFRYVDGQREPPSPAMFLGKIVHAALERHYRHRQHGLTIEREELAARLRQGWDRLAASEGVRFASKAEEQDLQRQAVALVDVYLQAMPADEPRPLAVEASLETQLVDPFTGEDLGIPLIGVVDLALDVAAGPMIVDFKTAARSSEALEILHEVQLTCYSYLLRQTLSRSESGLQIRNLIKTKTPQVQVHAYPARQDRHLRRLFAIIRAYLDDLDSGRFVYRPGLACSYCDFRNGRCQSWSG